MDRLFQIKEVKYLREISAGGVVYQKINNKIEFLMIQDRFSRWSLPKGHQEENETLEETALREIEEETGIIGKVIDNLGEVSYKYFHPATGITEKFVYFYLVEAISGEIKAQLSEIKQAIWLPPEQLKEYQEASGYENNLDVLRLAFKKLNVNVIL